MLTEWEIQAPLHTLVLSIKHAEIGKERLGRQRKYVSYDSG